MNKKLPIGLIILSMVILGSLLTIPKFGLGSATETPFSSTTDTHSVPEDNFDEDAEPSAPPTVNQSEWESMSDGQRRDYCSHDIHSKEGFCIASYNEDADCYYDNPNEAPFDIDNNCDLNRSDELCRQDKEQRIQECITSGLQKNPESGEDNITATCQDQFVCLPGQRTAQRYDNGLPYDNEFYSVTDTERGLLAPDQGDRFKADAEGGPIIGTVNQVVNILASLIALFSLMAFIAGAVMLITSNGEDNRIQKGKSAIKFSIIGIVFVMLSYTIVQLVQSILF